MTVEDFYKSIESSYEEAKRRLMSEKLIHRFLNKFLDDPSFNELKTGIDNDDFEMTYRAVHTLKGVAMNLGFEKLSKPCIELNEYLRDHKHDIDDHACELFKDIEKEYLLITGLIKEIDKV